MFPKKADSKITEKWISDVKKAWKYHKSQIERISDPIKLQEVTRDASKYFMRLQEDLLINKGFWYILGPYSERGQIKLRDKITKSLHEAGQALLGLALASDMVARGRRTKEDLSDMIDADLSEVDRILSRIIFATLKRELKKVEKLDLGSSTPTTVDLKGMKVVFDDKAERNPHQVQHQYEEVPLSPEFRKEYIKILDKARAMLSRKGLDHLWYGETIISNEQLPHLEFGRAYYSTTKDVVRFSGGPNRHTLETMIHELGHRHWFKFMSSHDRVAFAAYFNTGEVDPVTDYGGTNPEEDFAEVFAHYVTGKNMDRDQKERFQQFFGQRVSSSERKRRIAKRIATRRLSEENCPF